MQRGFVWLACFTRKAVTAKSGLAILIALGVSVSGAIGLRSSAPGYLLFGYRSRCPITDVDFG